MNHDSKFLQSSYLMLQFYPLIVLWMITGLSYRNNSIKTSDILNYLHFGWWVKLGVHRGNLLDITVFMYVITIEIIINITTKTYLLIVSTTFIFVASIIVDTFSLLIRIFSFFSFLIFVLAVKGRK